MKYYGDIEISDLLLQQLPEDDIPDQLKAMIHMTDNEKIELSDPLTHSMHALDDDKCSL